MTQVAYFMYEHIKTINCYISSKFQGNKVSFIQLKLCIILFQESKHKKEVVVKKKKAKAKARFGEDSFSRIPTRLADVF